MSSNELCIACRGFEQNSLWYTETSCCASPTEKCRSKWRKPALKVPKHKSKHTYLFVILSFFLCPWSYLLGAPCSLNCLDRRLHPPRHWCHDFREFVSHQQQSFSVQIVPPFQFQYSGLLNITVSQGRSTVSAMGLKLQLSSSSSSNYSCQNLRENTLKQWW